MRTLIFTLITTLALVAMVAFATDVPKVLGRLTNEEVQQVQDAQKDIQIAQLRASLVMARACGRAGLSVDDCVVGNDWSITKREPPPAPPAAKPEEHKPGAEKK